MIWSYNADLAGVKDWIRFTIGDTDTNSPLLYDEEIIAISNGVSRSNAAIACMEAILAKLARECDYKIGPESVSASDKYKNYQTLYVRVKKSLVAKSSLPTAESDTHIFDIGMMDSEVS